jgi:hypothetical protein
VEGELSLTSRVWRDFKFGELFDVRAKGLKRKRAVTKGRPVRACWSSDQLRIELSLGPVDIAHAKETRETLDERRLKNPRFCYFEVAREKRTQPFRENSLSLELLPKVLRLPLIRFA